MNIVGLGNSNNLTWMTLYSAADRAVGQFSLYIIQKRKLRDNPPLEHRNIRVSWIQKFSYSCLTDITLGAEIFSDLIKADIVLVSGEFIAHGEEIRATIPQHAKIIAIPIGFDLETLFLAYERSDNPVHQFVSNKMGRGLRCCDFSQCLDNSTSATIQVIKEAGLANKTPPVWRHLHVLRLRLASRLLSDINESPIDEDLCQLIRNSIFVASRLCPDVDGSVANKGGLALFNWIIENSEFLAENNIGIIFINRDGFSRNYIEHVRSNCRKPNLIRSVPELSYPQFMFFLRNALVAIDSFSISDSLRPHMTTSDALTVGTPIVSSLGNTQIAEQIRRDPWLRFASDPLELLSKSHTEARRSDYGVEFLKRHHEYLYATYSFITDKAEADFLFELGGS